MAEEIKHVDIEQKEEMLKCELTDAELLVFGGELANGQQDLRELEDQLNGIKADYKSKTTAKEADVIRLSNLIRQKYEMRKVECEVICDFDEATLTVKRMDTGAIVNSRPMTEHELQRELKLFPEKSGAGDGVKVAEKLITEAVGIINQCKRASTSTIQRRLGLGYNKAAAIMDTLEDRGVIGKPQDGAPREILIDLNKYEAGKDYTAKSE